MKCVNDKNNNSKEYINQCLRFMRFLNDSTNDTLFLWDVNSGWVTFGSNIDSQFLLGASENNSYTLSTLMHLVYHRDKAELRKAVSNIVKGISDKLNLDIRLIDRRGNRVWLSLKGKVTTGSDNHQPLVLGSFSSTAFGRRVDTLTGLFNDIKFKDDMKDLVAKKTQGFLLLIGIDDFKQINASNGRAYGDYILKKLSNVIEDNIGSGDLLYRLYGDCFGVILKGASSKMVSSVFSSVQVSMSTFCTISGGAVDIGYNDTIDSGIMLQYAENALDYAKKKGKNLLRFFAKDVYSQYLVSVKLQEEMANSIKNNFEGFFVCYQPLVDNDNYDIIGAEALLRFNSPSRGIVSPVEFIPILEKSEMIKSVGMWVLKTALISCREWRKSIKDFKISVNVSYVQLQRPEFCEEVLQLLNALSVPCDALTLEVTENIQLHNFDYYNSIFYQWRNHGIEIAMDDFGSGYSTFSYLKSLNFNKIKIDRSLVSGIDKSAYNFRLVDNIVELAHVSNISVCLEGVETEDELRLAKELRGDVLQGFLFDKPLDKAVFEQTYVDTSAYMYKKRVKAIVKLRERLAVQEQYSSHLAWTGHKDSSGYHLVDNNSEGILRRLELGLWIICMNEQKNHYQMYVNNTMADALGMNKYMTPEENYDFWFSHIESNSVGIVLKSVEAIISSGKIVQVEYFWNHPQQGLVKVRCVGIRAADADGMICMKGYHRTISNISALEYNEN